MTHGFSLLPSGVFNIGRRVVVSFFALTSKIPPLVSMLIFDADVKKTNVKTAFPSYPQETKRRWCSTTVDTTPFGNEGDSGFFAVRIN